MWRIIMNEEGNFGLWKEGEDHIVSFGGLMTYDDLTFVIADLEKGKEFGFLTSPFDPSYSIVEN